MWYTLIGMKRLNRLMVFIVWIEVVWAFQSGIAFNETFYLKLFLSRKKYAVCERCKEDSDYFLWKAGEPNFVLKYSEQTSFWLGLNLISYR